MAKKKPSGGRKAEKPLPKCKAIILAEKVIIEHGTEIISLIGIIPGFWVVAFPGPTREMFAFLYLVDGIGEYEITVEVRDRQEDTVIARIEGLTADFSEKLEPKHLIIQIPELMIQHQGKYDVVVLANGQEIDRQQFVARQPGAPRA